MAARYWRIAAIRTASNALALSALALSDGTTDYPAAVLTGALSPGFCITFDLGAAIDVSQINLTAITQPDFPIDFLLENSADNATWSAIDVLATLIYPGNGAATAVVLDDPHAKSVALLLHGATDFADSSVSPKAVTVVGNTYISNADGFFGGAAMYFDGAGDTVEIGYSTAFDITADHTIETRFSLAVTSGFHALLSSRNVGNLNYHVGVYNGVLAVDTIHSGGTLSLWGTTVIQPNTVHHMELSKQGTTWRLFLDGNLEAFGTASGTYTPTGTPLVVGASSNGYYWQGYMQELQITPGVARHTTNFTPPAQPYGALSAGLEPPALVAAPTLSGVTNIADESMPEPSLHLVPSQITTLDTLDGGIYQVVGTVAKKTLPANTPLDRRVMLIDERSHRVVREKWSDAAGNYTFNGVAGDTTYTTLAYDHLGSNRAVIADRIVPEVMP